MTSEQLESASETLDLARTAFAGDALLTGEDPLTGYAKDAARWMNIYRELISLQEDILARVGRDGDGNNPEAGSIVSADVLGLEKLLTKYLGRLEFWYNRHWELQGLAMDRKTLVASHREQSVRLTRREYQLLSLFLSYPNRTFAAAELAQRAWSDSRLSTDQVRIYIARLRRRLVDLGLPCRLVSQPRRGYSLVCD